MATIDQILRNNFGLTGKGEGFVKRTAKVKKYNPERFAEAYAVLKADQHKQIAEAALMRVNVMTWKARGEADSAIVNKVKDAGKDIWRTVKMLIGKLVIFFEELVAKFTSKVRSAEKLKDKLTALVKTIENRKDRYSLDEEITVKVPITGNATVNGTSVSSAKSNYSGTNQNAKFDHDSLIASFDTAAETIAAAKNVQFWVKTFAKTMKTKDYKNVYREIKGTKATIEKEVQNSTKGSFNPTISTTMSQSNQSRFPGLNSLLTAGAKLEQEQATLKKAKSALARSKKTLWSEDTIVLKGLATPNGSGYTVDKLEELKDKAADGAIFLQDIIKSVEETSKEYKGVKELLNRVKNAPTSVTGNAKPEDLQYVRTMCTRTSSAMNVTRKVQEVSLATAVLNISRVYTVITEALKKLDVENKEDDDEVVRFRKLDRYSR